MQVRFHCAVDYTCMVNSIKWFFTTPDNLTVVPLRAGQQDGDPHVHTIRAARAEHEGSYSCVAENGEKYLE